MKQFILMIAVLVMVSSCGGYVSKQRSGMWACSHGPMHINKLLYKTVEEATKKCESIK